MRSSLTLGTLVLLTLGAAMAWTAIGQKKTDDAKPFVTSLTIYPVALCGKPDQRVGEVVGLLLEKRGFRNVRIAEAGFAPPADAADFAAVAEAFGAHAGKAKLETEFAFYGEILGTHKTGVQGVRGVIVDRAGKVVWRDEQTPDSAAFKRAKPRNPMTCCMLIGDRVLPHLILAPKGERGRPGPMAKLWEAKSAMPPKAEFTKMKERVAAAAGRKGDATLTVYPPRIRRATRADAAVDLVKRVNDAGLFRAQAAASPLTLEIKPNSNQQRVLWDMARAFQNHVKKHPPATDYVLFADYLMNPKSGKVGGVHVAVCDKRGDWVIVDFQNEYQPDFQALKPEGVAGCTELAARRVAAHLND